MPELPTRRRFFAAGAAVPLLAGSAAGAAPPPAGRYSGGERISLNGRWLFRPDAGHLLRYGAPNHRVVKVDNAFNESMLPRGRSSDWAHDGGIYRPVRLLVIAGPHSQDDRVRFRRHPGGARTAWTPAWLNFRVADIRQGWSCGPRRVGCRPPPDADEQNLVSDVQL